MKNIADMILGGVASKETGLYLAVSQFYGQEAHLLDECRFREWFELLDENFEYYIPNRIAGGVREAEFPVGSYRVHDNREMVQIRIERLETDSAFSEFPLSRTLRVVGSIAINKSDDADTLSVTNALLMYRQRGTSDDEYELLPVRRNDLFRVTESGLKLSKRVVVMTESSLSTPNLTLFL